MLTGMGEPGIRIRSAQRVDAFAVAALTLQAERELDAGATARPGFLDQFADAWLADRARVTWLAEDAAGNPVGVIHAVLVTKLPSLRRPVTSWLHVSLLFVTRARRGEGIGSALLSTLLDWASSHDVTRVQLHATELGRSLYAAAGFEAPDESFLVRRLPAPSLPLALDPLH